MKGVVLAKQGSIDRAGKFPSDLDDEESLAKYRKKASREVREHVPPPPLEQIAKNAKTIFKD